MRYIFLYKIFGLFVAVLLFASCASKTDINIDKYTKSINKSFKIPESCKKYYTMKKQKVAVVNFTNNSTFGRANTKSSSSHTKVGLGFISISGSADKHGNTKVVDPRLASAFIPKIEQMLLNTKAVELYSRSDMDKIDTELKLQDSGLLDSNTVVKFGKLSGVNFIITGSIDYVKHKFQNYSQYSGGLLNAAAYSDNDNLLLLSAGIHLVSALSDGTDIEVGTTLKILDVKTGKIMFSKQVEEKVSIRSNTKPTYEELVGAVKYSINKALPSLKAELSKHFSQTGYIRQIKTDGDRFAVQINMGRDSNIKQSDKFFVLNLESFKDPVSGKVGCDISKTGTILKATNNINKKNSWLISDTIDNLSKNKLVKKDFDD
ncbi:MAG: hypothetical protein B1H07_04040 [Campylobacteraceae bacterium 4484_166]|nr:MAG: hypothetical protein B1H07_04040 [Campylobacteraceae bacterium 4484_166]